MVADSSDGVKTVKVGVIAHVHSSSRTALIISALRAMENVEVVEMTERDVVLIDEPPRGLRDILKDYPESELYGAQCLDLSPYGYSGRRGKGEKKRERAMQRRFYGRGNSF